MYHHYYYITTGQQYTSNNMCLLHVQNVQWSYLLINKPDDGFNIMAFKNKWVWLVITCFMQSCKGGQKLLMELIFNNRINLCRKLTFHSKTVSYTTSEYWHKNKVNPPETSPCIHWSLASLPWHAQRRTGVPGSKQIVTRHKHFLWTLEVPALPKCFCTQKNTVTIWLNCN